MCFSQTFEEFSHNQNNEENEDILLNSERLHFLMNLYGRELSAAVLIVGRDPLWHIKQKTVFARLCEKSAELHFDSLEDQLKVIGEHVCVYIFFNNINRYVYYLFYLHNYSFAIGLEFNYF